ncbi:MAG: DNA polymerase III subunit chi [Calditrichae bacterium]|nr:DNA polymerase III subunit chi [Calditrichota bacterium]MCB9057802.1 DNA polymerase III subunit chi [Calditrichia bacterium]
MHKPYIVFIELKIASKAKYVCDLAEKLYDSNVSVTIFTGDAKTVNQVDDLLWTWKQESFVPHSVHDQNSAAQGPVILTVQKESLPDTDALILFDPLPAEYLSKYKLIIDFAEVYHADKVKESRIRFKNLRDSGLFDLHFTQLGTILSKKSISLNPAE